MPKLPRGITSQQLFITPSPLHACEGKIRSEVHVRSGITDGLVRLSVELEDAEDIIADLDQALSDSY